MIGILVSFVLNAQMASSIENNIVCNESWKSYVPTRLLSKYNLLHVFINVILKPNLCPLSLAPRIFQVF